MASIFENKVLQKLKLSKDVNNKKYAPKLIFHDEKNGKIFMEDLKFFYRGVYWP